MDLNKIYTSYSNINSSMEMVYRIINTKNGSDTITEHHYSCCGLCYQIKEQCCCGRSIGAYVEFFYNLWRATAISTSRNDQLQSIISSKRQTFFWMVLREIRITHRIGFSGRIISNQKR